VSIVDLKHYVTCFVVFIFIMIIVKKSHVLLYNGEILHM